MLFKRYLTIYTVSKMSSNKIAIVTGANKGIGFEIAKTIAGNGVKTILACRTESLGKEAENQFKSSGYDAQFMQLDISDPASIDNFVANFKRDFGKLDILVNNAAIAFKNEDPTPFTAQARPTILTNFFGTVKLTELLLPLLRESDSGRVVNVASEAGHFRILKNKDRLDTLTSDSLTISELENLMTSFVSDVESGTHAEKGWPNTCYGMSKLAVIAATKAWARDETNKNVLINAGCPGYCDTDMTSHKGPRSAADGAKTLTNLALLPPEDATTGRFFANEQECEW